MKRSVEHPARQLGSVRGRYAAVGRQRRDAGPPRPRRPRPSSSRPTGQTARSPELARLEALLLLAREPVSTRRLAQWAGLADATRARTLVRLLQRHYDQERAAIQVEEIAGGFQLLTRPQFGPWLRRLHREPGALRLSTPALESLAVVAYRQPIARAGIEAIRGVGCGEMLRQLMERNLIRITGRGEELGRPFLYGTSRFFLRMFGLSRIEDLPRWDVLRAAPQDQRTAAGAAHEPSENLPQPFSRASEESL